MESKLTTLEAKIRELLPELKCRWCDGRGYKEYSDHKLDCSFCEGEGWLPPITLDHVLKLLPNHAYSEVKGFVEFHEKPQHFTREAVYWQLGVNLHNQKSEVVSFLHNLICTS